MAKQRIHLASGRCERVDRLLAAALGGWSRRRLQRLLEEGSVRVDGRRVRKGDLLRGERTIEVELPMAESDLAAEADLAFAVLFEDERCVVVDKPAGRAGHALRPEERGTVANFLVARFPECRAAGDSPLEAGLVHRLDTDTSGALLAARDREAWRRLREQFRAGTVGKCYAAVVRGDVRAPGEIERAIESDARSRRKVRVLADGKISRRARPAFTRYVPLARSPTATLLEVEIPTGVRHQIRAHLAAIGHPVLGDEIYGGGEVPEGRHLLHASRLAFDHPESGTRVNVESSLPAEFVEALSRLGLGESRPTARQPPPSVATARTPAATQRADPRRLTPRRSSRSRT